MAVDREVLTEIDESYRHAVVIFLDPEGYPMSVATSYRVDPERGVLHLDPVAGEAAPPEGREISVMFSHIRPQAEAGYDQRRYVTMWGRLQRSGDGLEFAPERSSSWDEAKVPFFQYSEVTVPQAKRYLGELSRERGREVRPRLAPLWLFLRATRLPFLTATFVPVVLGVAAAALRDGFDIWLALLTFLGGALIHLGLNVANDVFDTMSGADPANTTPTQFSGGSRVIHYGLLKLRTMALLSAGFYLSGIAIGLYLAATRGFWSLFWLGLAGVVISIVYTAPPFRLVHRGVGEVAVALGFGPIMLVGAYFVQARRFDLEPWLLSIPVAILIALVLYMNEVPDRAGDAAAGKRTLPVRLSKDAVVRLYAGALAVTYASVAVFAVTGLIARPAILALATIPLAVRCVRGLRRDYDDPYALMFSTMGKNIQLHLYTGLLLFAGYIVSIVADRIMDPAPGWLL